MVAKLLVDATSSPSNRTLEAVKGSSFVTGDFEDKVPNALYVVFGDDTEIVAAPLELGDPWDDASLETRPIRSSLFLDRTGRHTDYRVSYFHNAAPSFGRHEELLWGNGTGYQTALGIALSAALRHRARIADAVRAAAETRRLVSRALGTLDSEQVGTIRRELEALQGLLVETEAGSRREDVEPPPKSTPPPPGAWAEKVTRLKNLTALRNTEVAELLGVSPTNVQGWLSRGQGMRPSRQRHLLDTLKVLEDADRRLGGDEQMLRQALLTPVGPDGKTPFDFLAQKKYLVARGYLQSLSQPPPPRRPPLKRLPIRPRVQLPEPVQLAALEELSPTPRYDIEFG